jgi:sterol desaturase/sphingolipid hydroxylase (fatty acid hydroxylase superfamily)
MRSDAVCFLMGHLRLMHWPQIVMTFGLTLISGMALHDLIASSTGIRLSFDGVPPVPRIVLYYLIYTFFDYWAHRVDHMPLMWPLHRVHHAAEDFVVLTAARGHPGAALTQMALKTFPMAALGMSMTAIIDMTMFVAATNYFIHSRIPLRLGWVGRWAIQSPLHHRLHHLKLYDGRSWNYSICPLWDRIFGTWQDASEQPFEIGIEYDYRHGAWIVRDVVRDYGEFLLGWMALPGRMWRKVLSAAPVDDAVSSTMVMTEASIPVSSLGMLPVSANSVSAALTPVRDMSEAVRFDEFMALHPVPANAASELGAGPERRS